MYVCVIWMHWQSHLSFSCATYTTYECVCVCLSKFTRDLFLRIIFLMYEMFLLSHATGVFIFGRSYVIFTETILNIISCTLNICEPISYQIIWSPFSSVYLSCLMNTNKMIFMFIIHHCFEWHSHEGTHTHTHFSIHKILWICQAQKLTFSVSQDKQTKYLYDKSQEA